MLSKEAQAMAACMALVAGTAVGAGILAMPAKTVAAGFLPSTIILLASWIYMTMTALFVVEVGLFVHRTTKASGHGLVGLAQLTLGIWGGRVAAVVFVMLHYTLLAAYVSEGGKLLTEMLHWSPVLGPFVFSLVLGLVVAFANMVFVELLNTIAVAMLAVVFACIIFAGSTQVEVSNLEKEGWEVVHRAVPVCFVALVFHSVVPVIAEKLEYDMKRIRMAVVLGSFVPFVMFVAWNTVVIGITDPNANGVDDPMEMLRDGSAGSATATLASMFGMLAVTTSFIGFVLGLMSFYTDMFPNRHKRDKLLYCAVILPPAVAAMADPSLFEAAMDFAGTYGVTILFALLPAMMVWSVRYGCPPVCGAFNRLETAQMLKLRRSNSDEDGALELLEHQATTPTETSSTSFEREEIAAPARQNGASTHELGWHDEKDVADHDISMDDLLEYEHGDEESDQKDSVPLNNTDSQAVGSNQQQRGMPAPEGKPLVPGGKPLIAVLSVIAVGVIVEQMVEYAAR